MDCTDQLQQARKIWIATAKTSSVGLISPKRDLFVWISINRRYGESPLRKRWYPRGRVSTWSVWPFGLDENFMATARALSGSGYGNTGNLGMKTLGN